jgi:hypothetical protein
LTEAHTALDTRAIIEIAKELAKRLQEKPKGGEQGQPGEQGEQGEQGEPGEQGQQVSPVSPVRAVSNPVRAK